jgi:tol-pal system protein YbgF
MAGRDSMTRIAAGILLAGMVAISASSCATKKFMLTLHDESMTKDRDIESRLANLERRVAHIDSMTNEQYGLLRGTRAVVSNQSKSQEDYILSVSARLDNINHLMNELNQKLQAIQLYGGVDSAAPKSTPDSEPDASKGSAPSSSGSYNPISSNAQVDPKELYNTALSDLNNGDYDNAEMRFVAFLIQFPRHELAANAQYWLGEVDYAQKKYDLAVTEFGKVVKNYPEAEKVPAALLKTAYAQIELGKKAEAKKTLNIIIKEHKNSEEFKAARDKLRKLGR